MIATWGASQEVHVRHVTLTHVPAIWNQARNQIRDFARRIRKSYRWEWCWAIEENPRGTGYHLHGIQYGDYVPKRRIQELWGGRICYIAAMPPDKTGYLAKINCLAGYLAKDQEKLLKLNGGRCLHMSRGFLHGLKARQVVREVRGKKTWILVPMTQEEIRSGGETDEC